MLVSAFRYMELFRLCPPSLVGAYYLQPPDARAIFLHNDLLCNDTCSVTGGGGGGERNVLGGGAQLEKIPLYHVCVLDQSSKKQACASLGMNC